MIATTPVLADLMADLIRVIDELGLDRNNHARLCTAIAAYAREIPAEVQNIASTETPNSQPAASAEPFQTRVKPWLIECFGPAIASDREERNHRFLEEALELVQSCGCTASEAHQLVDYVFGRPSGEPVQEVGGVMVTLAALCLANNLDMHEGAEKELARINAPDALLKIRAKQTAKPKHSPLPTSPVAQEPVSVTEHWQDGDKVDAERLDWLEEQSRQSATGTSFDYGRLVEDGHVVEHGYRFMRRHFLGERKASLRAAIDAARATPVAKSGGSIT